MASVASQADLQKISLNVIKKTGYVQERSLCEERS